jgi:uncharacterized protein
MKKIFLYLIFVITANAFSQDNVYDIARKGTVSDLEKLLKQKSEALDEVNTDGYSPLILACYRGNTEVANYIVKKTKSINYISPMGTALMAAVVKGNVSFCELLLKQGANPNLADENGTTALIYATEFQNLALVNLLLKNKADKNLKNKEGKTAFEFAVFSGNQEIINQLKIK